MSILRTYNVQNPDSASTNIQLSADGGIAVAGITTVAAGRTSAPSITPTGDSNTGIFFPSPDTIAFAEGGIEAARFDSSGRLGIGTNNPTRILDVQASSSQDAAYISKNSGSTTTSDQGVLVLSATTTGSMSSGYGGSLTFEQRDSSGGYAGCKVSSSANLDKFGSDLVLYSRYYGYVEGMRIGSNGNVGINSTIPAAKLDIVGGSSQQLQVTGQEADIWLKSTGPGTIWRILGSTGGGTHRFRIYDQTNSLERFGIDSSGRVQMPYQPYARASSTSTTGSTNAIPLNSNSSYNYSRGGITISGNRFTVPVAGAYVIGYHHLGNSGSGACQIEIRHNGNYIPGTRTQDTNSSNDSFGTQTIKELSASDYVEFWVIQGAAHGNQDYNSMWIWLIG